MQCMKAVGNATTAEAEFHIWSRYKYFLFYKWFYYKANFSTNQVSFFFQYVHVDIAKNPSLPKVDKHGHIMNPLILSTWLLNDPHK